VCTRRIRWRAQTGRLASTDPNLQNIPIRTEEGRKIREAFIGGARGMCWCLLTIRRSSLRLLAHVADIPSLRQAFLDGIDIRAMTASEMLTNVPVKGMDPNRSAATQGDRFQQSSMASRLLALRASFRSASEAGSLHQEVLPEIPRYPGVHWSSTAPMAASAAMSRRSSGRKVWLPQIKSPTGAERSFGDACRRSTHRCRAQPPTSSSAR